MTQLFSLASGCVKCGVFSFFPIGALIQGRESHGLDHSSPVWILSFHRERQTREEHGRRATEEGQVGEDNSACLYAQGPTDTDPRVPL